VLKTRLSLRKYRVKKIWENADAEAMDVCLIETIDEYEPSRILEIDTTGHDVPYCADTIERFVKGEIPAGFGTIDWSAFLEV
jgi:adenylate kinase